MFDLNRYFPQMQGLNTNLGMPNQSMALPYQLPAGANMGAWNSNALGGTGAANELMGLNSGALNLGNEGFFSGMTGMDMLGAGIGGLQSLGSFYMGNQANKMAKQQFNTATDQWNKQWNAQRQLANQSMEERYAARRAGSGEAGRQNSETVDDYMKRNKI